MKILAVLAVMVGVFALAGGVSAQNSDTLAPAAAVPQAGSADAAVSVTGSVGNSAAGAPALAKPTTFSRIYLQSETSPEAPTVVSGGSLNSTTALTGFEKAVIQTTSGKAFVLSKSDEETPSLQLGQGTLSAEAVGEPVYIQAGADVKIGANKLYVGNQEIKIMPDAASQVAVERLGGLDFKIELKDVGSAANPKPIYAIQARRPVRILGLIPVGLPLRLEINAETGVTTSVVTPWWNFLAF